LNNNILTRLLRSIKIIINRIGNTKQCYICGKTFFRFRKYKRWNPKLYYDLDVIGSDINNFACFYCGSSDRDRHIIWYFNKLNIWSDIQKSKVLHFAPEYFLSNRIKSLKPVEYILADLKPKSPDTIKMDVCKIYYPDECYDFIICNHVLEHVPNYTLALKEIYRVLKHKGVAILQTPFSKKLNTNFEHEDFNTDYFREYFYGQYDHVRIFSENILFQSFKSANFEIILHKHSDFGNIEECQYWGMNYKEDLIYLIKN
jgi:SAM-dependent methyltransferase